MVGWREDQKGPWILPPQVAVVVFATAAVAGVVHGGFSAYWSFGGDLLRSTLGKDINATFGGARRWVLLPVGVIKIGFAVLPLILMAGRWPLRRLSRAVCWLGAAVLVIWGGVNTVVGNLVLSGLITPAGGFDHDGMVGHAWIWDPLFLLWGCSLIAGLISTRSADRNHC